MDKGTVPPTSTVRKFLALLEQSDMDFSEELGKGLTHFEVYVYLYMRSIGAKKKKKKKKKA